MAERRHVRVESGVRRWRGASLVAAFTFCLLATLPPSPAHARIFLVHDKGVDRHGWYEERSHLYRMDLQANDVVVRARYRTRYGESDRGPKRHEGDRRTPEGKYAITDIRQRSSWDWDSFGPWSLQISYPNRYDRQRWNPGDGILLHGGHDSITNGCIRVLDDGYRTFGEDNITELARITRWGTPILSAAHVPRHLKGPPGRNLGRAAAAFYRALLDRDLDNDTVTAGIRDYGRGRRVPLMVALRGRPMSSAGASTVVAVTATASSVYHQSTTSHYVAAKLLDGRRETAWCEGVPGKGEGQWIEIDLGRQRSIAGFDILNGYDKRGGFDRWKANGRMAKVAITIDREEGYTIVLNDVRTVQKVRFRRSIRARTVRFTIRSVYPGALFEDTCVSTLEIVYGRGGG